jgi:hypothetical protein
MSGGMSSNGTGLAMSFRPFPWPQGALGDLEQNATHGQNSPRPLSSAERSSIGV